MKTQHPPAPFMSLPHSKITLWDTTASSPPLPKDISSFTWSLLPRDLSLSRCPGEVSGSPAGHGPSSLFPSQAFLHAALVTRHFPPGKASTEPRSAVGGTWLQHPSGTPQPSPPQKHFSPILPTPAILLGCRDAEMEQSTDPLSQL